MCSNAGIQLAHPAHQICTKETQAPQLHGFLCTPAELRILQTGELARKYLNKLTVLISKTVLTGIQFSLLESAPAGDRCYPETCQNNQEL